LILFSLINISFADIIIPQGLKEDMENYPNIITQPSKCRPLVGDYKSSITYICDPHKVLNVVQINSLNEMIESVRKDINIDAPDCSRVKPKPTIAIALMSELSIPLNSNSVEKKKYASTFASFLLTNWMLQVNCKDDPDKIVIFYSVEEGVMGIDVGNQLRTKINKDRIRQIITYFQNVFYVNGLYQGLAATITVIRNIMSGNNFVNSITPIDLEDDFENYPNIITQPSKCRPLEGDYKSSITYICDPDKLLSVAQINLLNEMIESVRKDINVDFSDCSTVRPKPTIAIALLNKMSIPISSSYDEFISYATSFGIFLLNNWMLQVNCQDNPDKIIVFFSKLDEVVSISADTQLTTVLNNEQIFRIINSSKPSFSNNGAYQGLAAIIAQLRNVMTGYKI